MVEIVHNQNMEIPKELDMEEEIDLQEITVEKEEVVEEAGELIPNLTSKMKENEEMVAAVAAAGAMMMVEVEVEITGEETMTRICLHLNPIEEVEEEVEAIEAEDKEVQ
jgi:adenosylmethionine-8-amino-7-oxononanoate aminotransferase